MELREVVLDGNAYFGLCLLVRVGGSELESVVSGNELVGVGGCEAVRTQAEGCSAEEQYTH